MRNLLKLLAVMLVGYVAYELIRRYFLGREAAVSRVPLPEPMGTVHGAAMTAGGTGRSVRTLGPDGSSSSERVGRGVVRRG